MNGLFSSEYAAFVPVYLLRDPQLLTRVGLANSSINAQNLTEPQLLVTLLPVRCKGESAPRAGLHARARSSAAAHHRRAALDTRT